MYMHFLMSLNKCLEKCASLDLKKKKRERGGGLGGRAEKGLERPYGIS